jgi:hypothetical protein
VPAVPPRETMPSSRCSYTPSQPRP